MIHYHENPKTLYYLVVSQLYAIRFDDARIKFGGQAQGNPTSKSPSQYLDVVVQKSRLLLNAACDEATWTLDRLLRVIQIRSSP